MKAMNGFTIRWLTSLQSIRWIAAAAALAITLTATAAPAAADYDILKFKDGALRYSQFFAYWQSLQSSIAVVPDFNTLEEVVRQKSVRRFTINYLEIKEAEKSGFDHDPTLKPKIEKDRQRILDGYPEIKPDSEITDPGLKRKIESGRRKVIRDAYLEKKGIELVTDADLQAAYAEYVKKYHAPDDVKLRHIVVASEAKALEIIAQLKQGASFETLAKEYSTERATGVLGGFLGWSTREGLDSELRNIIPTLQPGGISAPIKSGSDWRVVRLEEKRVNTPDSFPAIKEILRIQLTDPAVKRYEAELLRNAEVKYLAPDGHELALEPAETPGPVHVHTGVGSEHTGAEHGGAE